MTEGWQATATPLMVWYARWANGVNFFSVLYRLPNGAGRVEYRWRYPDEPEPRWYEVRSKLRRAESVEDLRSQTRNIFKDFRGEWEDLPPAEVMEEVAIENGDVFAALGDKPWLTWTKIGHTERPRRVRRER